MNYQIINTIGLNNLIKTINNEKYKQLQNFKEGEATLNWNSKELIILDDIFINISDIKDYINIFNYGR